MKPSRKNLAAGPEKIPARVTVNNVFVPCVKCGGALRFDLLKGEGPEPDTAYICRDCRKAARRRP